MNILLNRKHNTISPCELTQPEQLPGVNEFWLQRQFGLKIYSSCDSAEGKGLQDSGLALQYSDPRGLDGMDWNDIQAVEYLHSILAKKFFN